jgi:DDE superfamily endonuclease
MSFSELPPFLSAAFLACACLLDSRTQGPLCTLLLGALFAKGRRTVSSWLRAACVGDDFRRHYHALHATGRRSRRCCASLLRLLLPWLLRVCGQQRRIVLTIDDTPTRRYGPEIQGAGLHKNPTHGLACHKYFWGHLWVSLAWVIRHPLFGASALPLRGLLYVRQKDLPKLNEDRKEPWPFRTKLELAVELVRWLLRLLGDVGDKPIWLVIDGGYAKKPLLRALLAEGVTIFGRLRGDAALRSLPSTERKKGQRGAMPKYGKQKYSLAKRAGQKRGWQSVECVQYGKKVSKQVKSFLATWEPVGGAVLVVLVKEEHRWLAFFCTDTSVSVQEVLEVMAERWSVEQAFKDVKEVWGAQQQQVREVYACVGAFNVNLWMYCIVEAWAWDKPAAELVDRSASPWDDQARRPSHQDKRKALQREVLHEEIEAALAGRPSKADFRALAERLLELAV